MVRPEDVPRLPGWLTFLEAAQYLGLTRQGLWYRVFELDQLSGIVDVGAPDGKPYYLISEEALKAAKATDQRAAAERAATLQQRENTPDGTRRRIRQWAIAHPSLVGATVSRKGPIPQSVVDAYHRANGARSADV